MNGCLCYSLKMLVKNFKSYVWIIFLIFFEKHRRKWPLKKKCSSWIANPLCLSVHIHADHHWWLTNKYLTFSTLNRFCLLFVKEKKPTTPFPPAPPGPALFLTDNRYQIGWNTTPSKILWKIHAYFPVCFKFLRYFFI